MVRDGRLELPTSCSQSKRATNCANPGFLGIQFCSRCGQTCGQAVFLTISACGESACIAGVSRDCGHGIFRLEGGATRSQSKRATNCANPGFLVIEFCTRCGQTCGQADFLTTLACGESASIAGVSRDCRDSVFQLERKASCSQSRRATNCATPRYEVRRSGWAYSPKASALPTALIPDMKFRLIRRPDVLTQECVCKWLRHRT